MIYILRQTVLYKGTILLEIYFIKRNPNFRDYYNHNVVTLKDEKSTTPTPILKIGPNWILPLSTKVELSNE